MEIIQGLLDKGYCRNLPDQHITDAITFLEALPWAGLGLDWSAFDHQIVSVRGVHFEDVLEVLRPFGISTNQQLAWLMPSLRKFVYGDSEVMISEMNAVTSMEFQRSFLFHLDDNLRPSFDEVWEYDGFDRMVLIKIPESRN